MEQNEITEADVIAFLNQIDDVLLVKVNVLLLREIHLKLFEVTKDQRATRLRRVLYLYIQAREKT